MATGLIVIPIAISAGESDVSAKPLLALFGAVAVLLVPVFWGF